VLGSQQYEYDSLSRQTTLNGGYERYLFDGSGERIARVTASTAGSKFFAITSCRVLDTRNPPPTPPVPVDPANPRTVQVGGNCGVPADASAVSGNLTVVTPSATGYMQAFPTGTSTDTGALNFVGGLTRASNINQGLSGSGKLTLASSASTHVILDVSGYYQYPAPSTWTLTFRDEASRLSTDYSVGTSISRTKNYFYFGSLLVATRDSGGNYLYYASDHLGTPRLVTNSAAGVVETHKYQPFGQEIGGVFGVQPLKFAAMERDASSGKDYDHARFLSPIEGRFLSPDLLGGKPEDPQTWNRYAYARNNPVRLVDSTGLAPEDRTLTLHLNIVVNSDATPPVTQRVDPQLNYAREFFGNRGIDLSSSSFRGDFDSNAAVGRLSLEGTAQIGGARVPLANVPHGPGTGSILALYVNESFAGTSDPRAGSLVLGVRSSKTDLTHEMTHILLDSGVKKNLFTYTIRELFRDPFLLGTKGTSTYSESFRLGLGRLIKQPVVTGCGNPSFIGPCVR
jgi:RHS repeat-associated protein